MKIRSFILALGVIFCLNLQAQERIERMEPPNWWVDMKYNTIQLLVYGDDITNLTPVIEHSDLSIKRIIKVKNPNYLFIYMSIAEGARPGEAEIHFYENGQLIGSRDFLLEKRENAEIEGFTTADVMYLITPDRFANANPENDNIPGMLEKANRDFKGGRHGGDIEGIENHLDYISDMGFTAVWLNPVLENDMPDYSYHGYAATDFYKIDRRFGTNESYREFCQTAGEKGIKVIMDMILNHCGSKHWFVLDPPTDDWINFQGEFEPTSHRRNTVQDIHASVIDKKHFSDGWFVETMPDLNQNNDLMADYLIQNSLWWIEYSGISGIRMDTYPYPDKDFMSRWTCVVMEEYPEFNIVGEEWTTNPAIVSYWQAGKENHDGYTSCLPSLMDFPIQDALRRGLTEPEKMYGSGLIETYKMLTQDFLYADPWKLVVFPDNHDMDRFFTQVDNDFDLFKMGIVYILTTRGTPQIYYGTEVLMENDIAPGDHGIIRSDFPGGWKNDKVNAFTGEGLSAQQKEAKAFMKKLLNWRQTSEVIHNGQLTHFVPDDGVYVFFRHNGKEKVMVILNKNEAETKLGLERFREILLTSNKAHDVIKDKEITLEDSILLPPRSPLILEISY